MRWYLRPHERRPQPPLPATDDRRPVVVGTVIWGVLLVVALVARDELAARDAEWWIASAAAGVGLGLLGILYMQRRHANLARDRDASRGDRRIS